MDTKIRFRNFAWKWILGGMVFFLLPLTAGFSSGFSERGYQQERENLYRLGDTFQERHAFRFTYEMYCLVFLDELNKVNKLVDFSSSQIKQIRKELSSEIQVFQRQRSKLESSIDNLTSSITAASNKTQNNREIKKRQDQIRKLDRKWSKSTSNTYKRNTNPLQFRTIKDISIYLASAHLFARKIRTERNSESRTMDRYPLWPSWIAEELGIKTEVVERLKKKGIELEKKYLKDVKDGTLRILKKHRSETDRHRLSNQEKEKLDSFLNSMKIEYLAWVRQVCFNMSFNKETQESLELSPSQIRMLQSLAKKARISRFDRNWVSSGAKEIQAFKKVFSPNQWKSVTEKARQYHNSGVKRNLVPHLHSLIAKITEEESDSNIIHHYKSLILLEEKLKDFRDDEMKKVVSEILTIVKPKERKRIRQFLGNRKEFFYSQFSKKTVQTWQSSVPDHFLRGSAQGGRF